MACLAGLRFSDTLARCCSPNTDGTIDAADMTAYEQLGAWVNDSFGEAKQQATDVVSCHDIAGIWAAFFSRSQRYRC